MTLSKTMEPSLSDIGFIDNHLQRGILMINIKDVHTSLGSVKQLDIQKGDLSLSLLSYGASIYRLSYKNRCVTVQPNTIEDFMKANFFYGKTIGRTAGRLILPSFRIDDNEYPITAYGGEKTKLHGGALGFSYRHFKLESYHENNESVDVVFSIVSPHMEEGYPGELTLFVTYTIDRHNTLNISFKATTTEDTLCNITNHIYVNLDGKNTIENHTMSINSSTYIDVDHHIIPRGKKDVSHTPFDLRQPTVLKEALSALKDTLIKGFDHAWLFDDKIGHINISNSKKDIVLDVTTDYPAVVIFAHNIPTKDPIDYANHGIYSSLTLECQYEPSGIHYPGFNHAILRKDEIYHHFMKLHFSNHES